MMILPQSRLASHLIVVFLVSILFAGCGVDRDAFLWTLGANLFVLYTVSIAAVMGLQRLHKMEVFISLV